MKKIDTDFGFAQAACVRLLAEVGRKTLARLVEELGANSRAFARVLSGSCGGL